MCNMRCTGVVTRRIVMKNEGKESDWCGQARSITTSEPHHIYECYAIKVVRLFTEGESVVDTILLRYFQ